MSSKLHPPSFIDDASEYNEYKKGLLQWSRITKVEKKNQAEFVVYHLRDHPSGIHKKIDTVLRGEIVEKDDGLTKLVASLDTIYKDDELAQVHQVEDSRRTATNYRIYRGIRSCV